MAYIIGLDTGGTYTDAVIVDSKDKKILNKIKTPTTKNDISIGIRNCIKSLMSHGKKDIKLVCISTTLATNALVENKGANVGLIYTGFDLEESIPAKYAYKVGGKTNINGEIIEEIDFNKVRECLLKINGKVEGLAVSGYASVKNPKQEQEIRGMATELLNVPVVCGHQLTSSLGIQQRTVTAVLNARLIPVIDELIRAVHEVMAEQQIDAPLMIVKGDGTLMSEKMALEKPIDTILSGPAASVAGAIAMTGYKTGIVMDMGGTTTDIAQVVKGTVRINENGAKVGNWFTRVKAVDIYTVGLGGNSKIYTDSKGNIKVGPESVTPLCMAGIDEANLLHEIQSFRRVGELKKFFSQETDCFMFLKERKTGDLSEQEERIVEMLKQKPHSISYIARRLEMDPEQLDFSDLVREGIIGRISMTPTDLLHCSGQYKAGDARFSQAAVNILTHRMGIGRDEFIGLAVKEIKKKLFLSCLQSAAHYDGNEIEFEDSPEAMYMLTQALGEARSQFMNVNIGAKKPIIAIGAPADAWLTYLSELLDVEVTVPENADVANSYGAAVAQITEEVELMISIQGKRFVLNCPWIRSVYDSREEAVFYAIHEGRKYIEHTLMDCGCKRWNIEEVREDICLNLYSEKEKTYTGTKLIIKGTGNLI